MTTPLPRHKCDQIIKRILASPNGIYGIETCQLDGRLGSFTGYHSAVMSHFIGSEFVAYDHRHPADLERRRERLRKQNHRFCEVCQAKVPLSTALAVGGHWLCVACAADPTNRDEDSAYPFRRLIRTRYLERLSDERLQAWRT